MLYVCVNMFGYAHGYLSGTCGDQSHIFGGIVSSLNLELSDLTQLAGQMPRAAVTESTAQPGFYIGFRDPNSVQVSTLPTMLSPQPLILGVSDCLIRIGPQ